MGKKSFGECEHCGEKLYYGETYYSISKDRQTMEYKKIQGKTHDTITTYDGEELYVFCEDCGENIVDVRYEIR